MPVTQVQNFLELVTYVKELQEANKYIKDFRCCDYDTILNNQTNIKYPCLWLEDTPEVHDSEEGDSLDFTFTMSMLVQESLIEKNRLKESLTSLDKLISFVRRMKIEANALGYEIIAQDYQKDFSLSVDKDERWRVELTITIPSCAETEMQDWTDL
jgi:hypothetical protein